MKFDPARAHEEALAIQQAMKLTGRVCSPAEELEAARGFAEWTSSLGLQGTFLTTVDDSGAICWRLKVNVGRGFLRATVLDPREWRAAMIKIAGDQAAGLGL